MKTVSLVLGLASLACAAPELPPSAEPNKPGVGASPQKSYSESDLPAFRAFFQKPGTITADDVEARFGRPPRYSPLTIRDQDEGAAVRERSWWYYPLGNDTSFGVGVDEGRVKHANYFFRDETGKRHDETIRDIRPVELKGSTLVGLPGKYAPAEFDPNTFGLRVGRHATTLHPFLQTLFDSPHDLRFSGSWYHDIKIYPLYLLLHIQPKNRQFHYELIFNLDTLQLIDLTVTLEEANMLNRTLRVDIPDEVRKSMDASIKTSE